MKQAGKAALPLNARGDSLRLGHEVSRKPHVDPSGLMGCIWKGDWESLTHLVGKYGGIQSMRVLSFLFECQLHHSRLLSLLISYLISSNLSLLFKKKNCNNISLLRLLLKLIEIILKKKHLNPCSQELVRNIVKIFTLTRSPPYTLWYRWP